MSDKSNSQLEEEIMSVIDFCGSEGASLNDIQRLLKSTLKTNVPSLESIQSGLNNAVAKGLLLKLDNGKYKIKDSSKKAEATAKNADSGTKSVSTSMKKEDTNVSLADEKDKVLTKLNNLHIKDNETKATARSAEENAQEVKRPLDKGTQDANRNADSDTRSIGSSLTKEDTKVSLPDDDEKIDKEKLIKGSNKDK